jgi:two-component system, OmpR family, phosphate regulon response regulator PhoB
MVYSKERVNRVAEEQARILVVDDDPALQKLVRTLLERAGMSPISAMNASEAAQILRGRPLPDAVVLDLMLPDISGIEFLRQMRQKEIYRELPVLILSALADPDQIREGLSAGADRYLTKPFLGNNLIPYVQDLLRMGRRK